MASYRGYVRVQRKSGVQTSSANTISFSLNLICGGSSFYAPLCRSPSGFNHRSLMLPNQPLLGETLFYASGFNHRSSSHSEKCLSTRYPSSSYRTSWIDLLHSCFIIFVLARSIIPY
ncbi:unnamed protein product [Vicia faba]|uniref:Uncharacterized protein n=1 Tax=Vicia faba TaxID=3906 RepID=A0AAV0ZVT1_VICFA|nr:unnamed protein product [Vicia faba]